MQNPDEPFVVIVEGGSFNPPHPGHFEGVMSLCDAFHTINGMMEFSNSPQKPPEDYAPLHHRLNMGRILNSYFFNKYYAHCRYKIMLTKVGEEIGSQYTWDVMQEMQRRLPHARLIWSMGADGMAEFDTWHRAEDIARNFSIAVVGRPPHTEETLSRSWLAKNFNRAATPEELLRLPPPGWVLLPALSGDTAHLRSRDIRAQLQAGQRQFDEPLQQVADYAVKHGCYGIPKEPRR